MKKIRFTHVRAAGRVSGDVSSGRPSTRPVRPRQITLSPTSIINLHHVCHRAFLPLSPLWFPRLAFFSPPFLLRCHSRGDPVLNALPPRLWQPVYGTDRKVHLTTCQSLHPVTDQRLGDRCEGSYRVEGPRALPRKILENIALNIWCEVDLKTVPEGFSDQDFSSIIPSKTFVLFKKLIRQLYLIKF